MTYHHLHRHAPYLPKAIDDENFAFYGKTLNGRQQQRERWQRGVDVVNGGLGEAIGQVYVQRHFPPESKAKVERAHREPEGRLQGQHRDAGVDVAGDARQGAREAGHVPREDRLPRQVARLFVDGHRPATLLGNVRAASLWAWRYEIDKLGKPVDKDEWHMTPQTVNAYYNPVINEIDVPGRDPAAAVLRSRRPTTR